MVSNTRIKTVGFYRKTTGYLSESLFSDAGLTIIASVSLIFLIGLGLNDYFSVSNKSSVIELLQIDFNISFPALSCELASVDIDDVSGTNGLNITKTIRKYSVDSNSNPTKVWSEPKNEQSVDEEDGKGSVVLNAENFDRISNQHAILVVQFYSPWCYWSKRMKPSWEETSRIMKERYDPEIDGRILLGEVDCTQETDLCRRHHIPGYPSIYIFRNRSGLITNRADISTYHDYEAYYGERDTKSLVTVMEDLVSPIPLRWRRTSESPGNTKEPVAFRIEVSLLVKKHDLNITKPIRKYSRDSNLNPTEFWSEPIEVVTKNDKRVDEEDGKGSVVLNAENFDRISKQHAMLVVMFYAPWCQWSKRLKPSWEETTRIMKERYDPEIDGRILLGEIDCTQEPDLCQRHQIDSYPSVRIFRKGSDLIVDNSRNEPYHHEAYYGDRDTASLVKGMEDLVAQIPLQWQRTLNSFFSISQLAAPPFWNSLKRHFGLPLASILEPSESPDTKRKGDTKEPVACRIEGSLLVKKVPLKMIISTRSATNGTRVYIQLKAKAGRKFLDF